MVSLVLAVPLGLSVTLAVNFVMVLVARLLFGAALAGAFLSLYVARKCPAGLGGGMGTEDAPGFRMPHGHGTHGAPSPPLQGWSCATPHTGSG